jgi:hypothetical protein
MKLEQLQKNDSVLMAEIGIQLRITMISKMVESIAGKLEEIEKLYEIFNSKKRW